MRKTILNFLLVICATTTMAQASPITKSLGEVEDFILKLSNIVVSIAKDAINMKDIIETHCAIDNLKDLSGETTKMHVSQSIMLDELELYIHMVEKKQYNNGAINTQWNEVAKKLQAITEQSSNLKVMTEKYKKYFVINGEYSEYLSALARREAILTNLKQMHAPTMPEDIAKLKKIAINYKILVRNLINANMKLNASIKELQQKSIK